MTGYTTGSGNIYEGIKQNQLVLAFFPHPITQSLQQAHHSSRLGSRLASWLHDVAIKIVSDVLIGRSANEGWADLFCSWVKREKDDKRRDVCTALWQKKWICEPLKRKINFWKKKKKISAEAVFQGESISTSKVDFFYSFLRPEEKHNNDDCRRLHFTSSGLELNQIGAKKWQLVMMNCWTVQKVLLTKENRAALLNAKNLGQQFLHLTV